MQSEYIQFLQKQNDTLRNDISYYNQIVLSLQSQIERLSGQLDTVTKENYILKKSGVEGLERVEGSRFPKRRWLEDALKDQKQEEREESINRC